MLDNLTARLARIVKTIRGEARLTEAVLGVGRVRVGRGVQLEGRDGLGDAALVEQVRCPHPSFRLFSSVSRSFTMTFSFCFSSSPSISCSASPMCGMYLSM